VNPFGCLVFVALICSLPWEMCGVEGVRTAGDREPP
jgi:hypothetical protein